MISAAELATLMKSDTPHAVLDLRERGAYQTRHIFRATSLPRRLLEVRLPAFVPARPTAVVIYDDTGALSALALPTLRAMGYRNILSLEGGLDGWIGEGRPTAQGVNTPSKVFGERVLHDLHTPEVTCRELDRRMAAGEDMVIVDTRTPEEYARGCLPGAWSMPGGELVLRLGDLAERHRPRHPLGEARLVERRAGHRRNRPAGADRVDATARRDADDLVLEAEKQATDDGRLGRGVVRVPRLAEEPGRRADENEVAVAGALDLLQEPARSQERRGQVGRERLLPALQRESPERHVLLGPDTGDGDADVEAAERATGLLEESVDVLLARQVCRGQDGALAAARCYRFGPLEPAMVVDDDASTFSGEGERAGGADAAGGTRD